MFDIEQAEVTAHAITAERMRADARHGPKSIEHGAWNDPRRLRILVEEVGEVAKVLNELDLGAISEETAREQIVLETLQVAACAAAWAESADRTTTT